MSKSLLLHALRRIRRYLTVEKTKLLAKAFINSQFSCAMLILMFADKLSIVKICKVHFRTLQAVYNNDKTHQELLNFSSNFSVHQRHYLRFLVIEVCKSFMNINLEFMWEFVRKHPVERNLGDIVYLPPVRSSCYGVNTLAFRGSLLWNNLQSDIKQSTNLEEFKLKLSNLGNIHCTCVVYKRYRKTILE